MHVEVYPEVLDRLTSQRPETSCNGWSPRTLNGLRAGIAAKNLTLLAVTFGPQLPQRGPLRQKQAVQKKERPPPGVVIEWCKTDRTSIGASWSEDICDGETVGAIQRS